MIIIMILLAAILLFFSVILFKSEITPLSIMYAASLICLFSSGYVAATYGVNFCLKASLIISTGLISVFLGGYLADRTSSKKYVFDDLEYIYIPRSYLVILVGFSLFVCIITTRKIGFTLQQNAIAYKNLSELISKYRLFYLRTYELLPAINRILLKLLKMLAYLFIVIVSNNLNVKRITFDLIAEGLVIFIAAFTSMIQGSRTDLVYFVISFFTIFTMMYQRKKGALMKYIVPLLKLSFGVLILMIVFSNIRFFVGRVNRSSALEYILYYFGASTCAFQKYIEGGWDFNKGSAGFETFSSLCGTIHTYIWENVDEMRGVFCYVGGRSLGNTYTAFKKYYRDFGILGVIVFSFLHSFIINKFYLHIRSANYINIFMVTVFAYLVPAFYLMLYDEHLFSLRLSFGTFSEVVFIYAWVLLIIKIRFKITLR